ncbi:NADH dehydrogenase [ubiquinone] 1 beta subcomplex subunit 7-like [Mytilus edulis]
MGGHMTRAIDAQILNPDVAPDYRNAPKFDPMLGFQNGRKERVMMVSAEDMDVAKVPLRHRGYCAHLYIEWRKCMQDHFFMTSKCGHPKHDFENCEFEDYVLRMKEYEREKRLLKRQKRIREKQLREDIGG